MKWIRAECARLRAAAGYSLAGLRWALRSAAFRLELATACVLIPWACAMHIPADEKRWLVASVVLVLVVEILNTALETTVDRISTERHPLSGQAKDLGSAAVLVSLGFAAFIWGGILIH